MTLVARLDPKREYPAGLSGSRERTERIGSRNAFAILAQHDEPRKDIDELSDRGGRIGVCAKRLSI